MSYMYEFKVFFLCILEYVIKMKNENLMIKSILEKSETSICS